VASSGGGSQKQRLKRISDARLARIDGDVSWFTGAIESLARDWEAEIVGLLAELPTPAAAARVGYLQELKQELRRQLSALGYEDLAAQFVDRFDGAREQAMDTLKAMNVTTARLAPLDESALAALRQLHLDSLVRAGSNTVEEVSRGVVLNAVGGRSRADMIRGVRDTLDSKLVGYASTYADTALVSYDRTVSWQMWESAGIAKFIYRGPMDVKTRPFCQARVGKTFTKAEIAKMTNGTRLEPVSIYGGGWNCRHVWSPVVVEEAHTANNVESELKSPEHVRS
jgi:hypothetical protein